MIDEVLNEIHKGSHIKPGHR